MFWRQFKKFAIFIKMVRILRKMSHTKFPAYQYQKNIWQKHECPLPIQYPLYIWKITSFIYFVSQTVEDKEDTYHVPRSDSESSSRQNPEEETDLSHEAAMKSEGSDGRSRFRCICSIPPYTRTVPTYNSHLSNVLDFSWAIFIHFQQDIESIKIKPYKIS